MIRVRLEVLGKDRGESCWAVINEELIEQPGTSGYVLPMKVNWLGEEVVVEASVKYVPDDMAGRLHGPPR